MVFSNYYFSLYYVYAYIHTCKDPVNIYSLCALAFAQFTREPERMPTECCFGIGFRLISYVHIYIHTGIPKDCSQNVVL